MDKLSYEGKKSFIVIKLILNITQLLKIMFQKEKIERDSINFDIFRDIKNKEIRIKFKEIEVKK